MIEEKELIKIRDRDTKHSEEYQRGWEDAIHEVLCYINKKAVE